MTLEFQINGRAIGPGHPTYIIAEVSANHGGRYEDAERIVVAAKEAGADAVKLQTYTADTMTMDVASDHFVIGPGSIWAGRSLHDLYEEAFMPWDWQPRLRKVASDLGLAFFSTAFDETSADFLDTLGVPAHKIASSELVDIPLVRYLASKRKPLLISTGMGTLEEIAEAVTAARTAGASQLALLKCTSAYPAPPEDMHLQTIPHMRDLFDVPVGLSDHTLGITVPVAAVSLGACLIEKHLTLSRATPTADSQFSLEPAEFKEMVQAVRVAERARGQVRYGPTMHEAESRRFRRSLFASRDIADGEPFSSSNVRCIRPAQGLHPRYLEEVLQRRASRPIARGTPLSWELVGGPAEGR